MLEVVRACMRAESMAEVAEFFSFGTNDLTQATFSFSREDAENKFLPMYNENRILQEHPTLLFPMTINASELSSVVTTSSATVTDIPTVGTAAFLAAHEDTPSELVIAVLDAIYQTPPPFPGLIPREQAIEWQELLLLHDAAREYYHKLGTR